MSKFTYTAELVFDEQKGKYKGSLYRNDGVIVRETVWFISKELARKQVNSIIEEHNLTLDIKPKLKPISATNVRIINPKQTKTEKMPTVELPVFDLGANKLDKPKSELDEYPTPCGLNGYLVDNNGNIHLMLDRKPSTSTVVLELAMFARLAELVNANKN